MHISGLAVRRYNVSLSEKEANAYLRRLLCSDLYFEVNPIVICIFVLRGYICDQVTDSNFYLLFEGISEGDLKIKLSEAKDMVDRVGLPSSESVKAVVDKFEKIKSVAAQLKRVKLKKAEFHQPEALNLKKVKKEVSS